MTGLRLREEGLRRERLASEHLRGPGLLEERSRHGFIWKWSQTGFTAEESRAQRWRDLPEVTQLAGGRAALDTKVLAVP